MPHGDGKELSRLELLHDEESLRLGPTPGLVVAREGQEDNQSKQDGEAGGEHAEDACRPVAVVEEAPVRSSASNEQQNRDCDSDGDPDDQDRPNEIHLRLRLLRRPTWSGLAIDATDRHAGLPRAIKRSEIEIATHRTITASTQKGMVFFVRLDASVSGARDDMVRASGGPQPTDSIQDCDTDRCHEHQPPRMFACKPLSGPPRSGPAQLGERVTPLGTRGPSSDLPRRGDEVAVVAHLPRSEKERRDAVAEVLAPRSTSRRCACVGGNCPRNRTQAEAEELPAEDGHKEHSSRMISAAYEARIVPRG